jgi:hypothetical protein
MSPIIRTYTAFYNADAYKCFVHALCFLSPSSWPRNGQNMYEILMSNAKHLNGCNVHILLDVSTNVMFMFCVHTSTVQLSGAIKRTPFTDPPRKKTMERSQTPTGVAWQTRWRYGAIATGPAQLPGATTRAPLSTFGVLRPVLFPLQTGACVVVYYTASYFCCTLSSSELPCSEADGNIMTSAMFYEQLFL